MKAFKNKESNMALLTKSYPATLDIEYPKKLDRLSTLFRIFLSIPVFILMGILMGGGGSWGSESQTGDEFSSGGSFSGWDILTGLFIATALMIVIRQRYPRWWFDFALELNRFTTRVGAYLLLLTDKYPSTEEKQSVRLDVAYPDARKDLSRWLPLVKWLLAIPHYFILLFLMIGVFGATVIAWFAILFTGRYPRSLFDFVVGVGRWNLRVNAYAFLLVTDKYPPFTLK
jgi:hypothetical protein